jgi:hypothetical protein
MRLSSSPHGTARRFKALGAVLIVAGAVSISTATSALAATCKTSAHIYLNGGLAFRTEFDPIDGQVPTINIRSDSSVRLGGNGLKPGTTPVWKLYARGTLVHQLTLTGSTTSGNCVSNERDHRLSGGNTWDVRATYTSGNSGNTITDQLHFRIQILPEG